MKYHVLERIFNKYKAPRKFESLELNTDFHIINKSNQSHKFADCPEEVKPGKDIRQSFPEFIGLEGILTSILQGEQEFFEIEGVNRSNQNQDNFYIDIYIIGDKSEKDDEARLIVLIEDVTNRMLSQNNFSQQINETNLLSNALLAYKSYMDKVVTSMADALIVTTKTGKIKKVNRASVELFGYSEEELIGQQISLIIHDHKLLQKAIQQQTLFKKYFRNIEVFCRTKNQEKILIAFSCSVIYKNIDGLEDIVYIGRDITAKRSRQQRKSAQYAITSILSESKTIKAAIPQILQAICESLGWDLGEVWSPSQYITALPQHSSAKAILRCVEIAACRTVVAREFQAIAWQTTYSPGVGLPGRIWSTRSPLWIKEISYSNNCPRAEIAVESGLHCAFGFPILNDSKIFGVMIFFSREMQPQDEDLLQMMVSLGSQIAQFIQRKHVEEALLESEEKYRDLFENANDLIQCVNPYGRILYVNRAWEKTLGYSNSEIVKLNLFEIIHPDFRASSKETFYRVMSGESFKQVQAAFLTKNNQTIFLEGNINCKFVRDKPVEIRAIFRDITERIAAEEALRHQQEQTERLLLNILPEPIANRLKQEPGTIAENFPNVTVLFADIVGFTQIAASVSAIQLVNLLNQIFSVFDRLSVKYDLEKIKTIGDAYMVVGGLLAPNPNDTHAIACMALDMLEAIAQFNIENNLNFSIRIGINIGPVVAGVIGIKKFTYDLWGDTVNIASRMESQGLAGQIQVTEAAYLQLRDKFVLKKRGEIEVKGKGKMITYILISHK